jgi:hypothetical protein
VSQLSFREEIAATVMSTFITACDPWGVTVERVEVNCYYFMKERFNLLMFR